MVEQKHFCHAYTQGSYRQMKIKYKDYYIFKEKPLKFQILLPDTYPLITK